MGVVVQIGAKLDSGFDDPIGMLTDCHRRIEQFLKILATVAECAAGRNLTGEEIAAVGAAIQYFRTGGTRHTRDEEESLFPRLRAAQAGHGLAELEALEEDHHQTASLHLRAEKLYAAWIADGRLAAAAEQELSATMQRLSALYQAHIGVEESVVFVQARKILDSTALDAVGQEFRARRTEP